jgi:hypothetical protein
MISSEEYNGVFRERLGPLDDEIRNRKFVIGGSFVVATIRGTNDFADVDVYVTYAFKSVNRVRVDSEFDDWIVREMGGVLVLNISYPEKSWKYICPNMTVNLIAVSGDPHVHVRTTSDLDVCTSTYDGYLTRYPPCLLMGVARIINTDLVHTTFSGPTGTFDDFQRVFNVKRKTRQYKYMQRGFRIINAELSSEDVHSAIVFLNKQHYRESTVRDCLWMIASRVHNESPYCLGDYILGSVFPFELDVPVLPLHECLTPESYPWAPKWK